MGLLAGILGFAFLIFFHELGHFLFAKLFGVKVYTFSIGFGKKIFVKKIGNTEYALSIIPLGGYVKLKGESVGENSNYSSEVQKDSQNKQYDNDSINAKHPFKRILISFAGPLFNFILAFIVYIFIFNHGVFSYTHKPIIGDITKDSKALNILVPGDVIKKMNDQSIFSFSDLSAFMDRESTQKLDSIKLEVLRNMTYLTLDVPLTTINNKKFIGVQPHREFVRFSFLESISKSFSTTIDNIFMIYNGIKKLITGAIGLENISSVIGMVDISAKAFNSNIVLFFLTLCIISVNLGIVNLLPLPMLDGGQILFDLYRWGFKRDININVAKGLMIAGFVFIIGLMSIGIFNDINRMIS